MLEFEERRSPNEAKHLSATVCSGPTAIRHDACLSVRLPVPVSVRLFFSVCMGSSVNVFVNTLLPLCPPLSTCFYCPLPFSGT